MTKIMAGKTNKAARPLNASTFDGHVMASPQHFDLDALHCRTKAMVISVES
jgi:hypothetical protein